MKPIDWSTEKDFPRLKAAVYHHLTGLGTKASIDVIPDRTLTRHANNFRDIMYEKKIAFEDISSAMIFRNKLQRQKMLSDSDIYNFCKILLSLEMKRITALPVMRWSV